MREKSRMTPSFVTWVSWEAMMWFAELKNMGKAIWAICKEQGPADPETGQVCFDGNIRIKEESRITCI